MLERLGATLQLFGLFVVGVALLRGVAGASSLWGELAGAGLGGGIFTVGWALSKRGTWQS